MAVRTIVASVALSLLCCATVDYERVWAAQTSAAVPVVVELFTSEGCSSCPPADAFLQRLQSMQPIPGARLITLSEHVTYWNHDGWKDPYSSDQLTDRQQVYVTRFGLPSPYTPQFVVDGAEELKLTDEGQVRAVFDKALKDQLIPVTITSTHIDKGGFGIVRGHIDIDGTTSKQSADIYVAVTLHQTNSDVSAGENKGRKLTETEVVLNLEKIGKTTPGRVLSRDFEVKLKSSEDPANLGLVVVAQAGGTGKIVGAASVQAINSIQPSTVSDNHP
ncbi:MAG TPA: DUF1223 domain-containing protein [Acidobacteriaceae bacterium]|jgi:hypothetical protein|nr:DUF1223 domain-containing protein [Acidobacteriaceae bacterium]